MKTEQQGDAQRIALQDLVPSLRLGARRDGEEAASAEKGPAHRPMPVYDPEVRFISLSNSLPVQMARARK